jgi:hypothetical protein
MCLDKGSRLHLMADVLNNALTEQLRVSSVSGLHVLAAACTHFFACHFEMVP